MGLDQLTPEDWASIKEIGSWTLPEVRARVRALNVSSLQGLLSLQTEEAAQAALDEVLNGIRYSAAFEAWAAWILAGERPLFLERKGELERIIRKPEETLEQMQARRGTRGGVTLIELAAETGWSESTLRRWFEMEPGVSESAHPEAMNKRRYTSLRIPRHVADRVLARHARK